MDISIVAPALQEEILGAQKRIAELEQEIERLRSASKWMPIETAPHETDVILYAPPNDHFPAKFEIGWASGGKRVTLPDGSTASNKWNHGYATHWLPLPSPPEGET